MALQSARHHISNVEDTPDIFEIDYQVPNLAESLSFVGEEPE